MIHAVHLVLGGTAVFLLSLVAVALGLTGQADLAFTRWLQQFASPALDRLADMNTIIGQATVDAVLTAILAAGLFVRGPRLAAVAPLLIGLTLIVEVAGKVLLTHPAPPFEFVRTAFNPLGFHIPTSSSFPSGHVSRTAFLAVFMASLAGRRWVTVALASVAIATPFLRIYLGDHWLSDTIGAAGLGVATGGLAVLWLRRFSATG